MDNEKKINICEGMIGITGFHGADIKWNGDDFELTSEVAIDDRRGAPRTSHPSGRSSKGHFGSLEESNFALGLPGDRND